MERISREELYRTLAYTISKRSTCPRKHVGAILVKDNRVIAMGYNGVLPGTKPEEGINEDGSSNTVHAEANIISFCAKEGIPTNGTSLHVTLSPCKKCAELIIQAGITKVYYYEKYRCLEGIELLRKHKIKAIFNNAK